MTLSQLETFMAIVRLGTFSAAANKLSMTQSTVSARIKELEKSLGGHLFDRTKRTAQLTSTGRQLVHYATQVLSLGSEMRHLVGGPQAVTGTIRLGVAELIAVTWLPDLVTLIKQRYPRLSLEFDIGLTMPIHAALRRGDLDLALMPGEHLDPGLRSLSLGSVEFVWTAGPMLSLQQGILTPNHLAQMTILTLGTESYHHNIIENWFGRHKPHRARVDICNSMSVLAALTTAGLGISLLPKFKYAADIGSGALRQLKTKPRIPRCVFSAVHFDDPPNPVARLIAELAQSISAFHQKRRPIRRAPSV
jgi:DNA-binding transcriptional LysR family regulator